VAVQGVGVVAAEPDGDTMAEQPLVTQVTGRGMSTASRSTTDVRTAKGIGFVSKTTAPGGPFGAAVNPTTCV
jgi:hypothetical protein